MESGGSGGVWRGWRIGMVALLEKRVAAVKLVQLVALDKVGHHLAFVLLKFPSWVRYRVRARRFLMEAARSSNHGTPATSRYRSRDCRHS